MRRCPVCDRQTIPVWHAYTATMFAKPFTCTHCHSRVTRRRGWLDYVTLVPLTLTSFVAIASQAQPSAFVWYSLALSGVAGFGLWEPLIRYDKFGEKKNDFKPHSSKLDF